MSGAGSGDLTVTMSDGDESERLRIDDDSDLATFSAHEDGGAPVGAVVLAITKTITTYPSAAGKFFACQTAALTGTETEGSAGTATGQGDTFFAYLPAGATVPASGAVVPCVRVPDRWVMLL